MQIFRSATEILSENEIQNGGRWLLISVSGSSCVHKAVSGVPWRISSPNFMGMAYGAPTRPQPITAYTYLNFLCKDAATATEMIHLLQTVKDGGW